MRSHRDESLGTFQRTENHTQQIGNDRNGLIGFLALLGLAFPALGIRYLLPDLNPIFLAGLGVAVYGIYLGMLTHYLTKTEEEEPALEPVKVKAGGH